ncbi:hypothetical protein [Staphylococcus aureus]|uniref:hypothetical protein n=1 Tax=Staphylococcus aureus TaxID=1280 RepID=UPI001CE07C8C|nr:hypothetical protein [Staphylococcus aureus]MCA1235781.1 hypothetical protein [Staphylococcus aureus]
MKLLKKKTIGFSAMTLVLLLSGCQSNDSGKEKTTTMAEILNGKEERKIVMTHDTQTYDSPDIYWAGTIGNGKMEIHPYKNLDKFEFNDVKNISMKEYKKLLSEKDREYSKKKGKKLDIYPVKAKIYYKAKDIENPRSLIFDYDAKFYSDEEKFSMINKGFSVIEKDHPDDWLCIRTRDESGKGWTNDYVYVEAKNGEKNLVKDDLKKAMQKYDNVKRIK